MTRCRVVQQKSRQEDRESGWTVMVGGRPLEEVPFEQGPEGYERKNHAQIMG